MTPAQMVGLSSEADEAGDAERAAIENDLWRRLRTDADPSVARAALFDLHYPFAKQLAHRHHAKAGRQGMEFSELCQLACVGLLEATDRYDPDLGVPFRGFARRRIDGAIIDGLAHSSELRQQLSHRAQMRRERARSLFSANGEELSTGEAMDAFTDLIVGLALGFMMEEAGTVPADATWPPTAYRSLVWKEALQRASGEIENLPRQENLVVRHHYLEGLAFETIARLMSLTKGRISQIHRAALQRLRRRLSALNPFNLSR